MDLDGEVERLRAEARARLEGERELEERLLGYEKDRLARALGGTDTSAIHPARTAPERMAPDAPPSDEAEPPATAEQPRKAAPAASSVAGRIVEQQANEAAEQAAEKVSSLSTPKLIATAILLVFGAIVVQRLIGPIVALLVLAIIIVLGYRFLVWLSKDDGDDDDDQAVNRS